MCTETCSKYSSRSLLKYFLFKTNIKCSTHPGTDTKQKSLEHSPCSSCPATQSGFPTERLFGQGLLGLHHSPLVRFWTFFFGGSWYTRPKSCLQATLHVVFCQLLWARKSILINNRKRCLKNRNQYEEQEVSCILNSIMIKNAYSSPKNEFSVAIYSLVLVFFLHAKHKKLWRIVVLFFSIQWKSMVTKITFQILANSWKIFLDVFPHAKLSYYIF